MGVSRRRVEGSGGEWRGQSEGGSSKMRGRRRVCRDDRAGVQAAVRQEVLRGLSRESGWPEDSLGSLHPAGGF